MRMKHVKKNRGDGEGRSTLLPALLTQTFRGLSMGTDHLAIKFLNKSY